VRGNEVEEAEDVEEVEEKRDRLWNMVGGNGGMRPVFARDCLQRIDNKTFRVKSRVILGGFCLTD